MRNWYKQNYGAEFGGEFFACQGPVWTWDYNTWQAGQTLYDLYNTEKQAGEAYGQRIGDIDKQADFQNQQAYILAQKLQKYLGLTASAQGQKGIAAGDLIAANADYQNRLGSIASEMQGYRQDAEAGKQTALSTAKKSSAAIARGDLRSAGSKRSAGRNASRYADRRRTRAVVLQH